MIKKNIAVVKTICQIQNSTAAIITYLSPGSTLFGCFRENRWLYIQKGSTLFFGWLRMILPNLNRCNASTVDRHNLTKEQRKLMLRPNKNIATGANVQNVFRRMRSAASCFFLRFAKSQMGSKLSIAGMWHRIFKRNFGSHIP